MPRPNKLPTLEEAEAKFQEGIRIRNGKIAELRRRSGLSMEELAKAMGFKGQSGVQRYLDPNYDKGFRPEIVAKFRKALLGRGDPEISEMDMQPFYGPNLLDVSIVDDMDTDWGRGTAKALSTVNLQVFREGVLSATLPISEGQVVIELPRGISMASADSIHMWADHLINLASGQGMNEVEQRGKTNIKK